MKQFLPLAIGVVATYGVVDAGWPRPAQATDAADDAEFSQAEMPVEAVTPVSTQQDAIALNFDPPGLSAMSPPPSAKPAPATIASRPDPSASTHSASTNNDKVGNDEAGNDEAGAGRADLFAGGSQSVVARTVGAAEGTRNPDGSPTTIYEGHVDPGNGVWNRGTFSYQFGNEENLSAEEADRRQIAKIKRIHESVLLPKAEKHGVAPLTLAEELNGIDLINQAPLTVTEAGGYIERLAEAKTKKGLTGQEAILEARIWSFWDPSRDGWDAPGLRAYDDMGKEASIRHDQKRRMGMIEEALAAYEQQQGAIAQRSATEQAPTPESAVASSVPRLSRETRSQAQTEQRADLIIFGSAPSQQMPVAVAQR